MLSKIIIFTAILAIVSGGKFFDTCTDEREEEVDNCLFNFIVFSRNQSKPFPESAQQIQKLCDYVRPGVNCVKSFSKDCLDSLERQVINLALSSVRQGHKKYCSNKNSDKIPEYIKVFRCLNSMASEFNMVMEKFNNGIMQLAYDPRTLDEKLPIMCCKAYELNDKSIENIRKSKNPNCKGNTLNIIYEFLENLVYKNMEEVCEQTPKGSPVCSKISYQFKAFNGPKPKTPFLPLVKLLTS